MSSTSFGDHFRGSTFASLALGVRGATLYLRSAMGAAFLISPRPRDSLGNDLPKRFGAADKRRVAKSSPDAPVPEEAVRASDDVV